MRWPEGDPDAPPPTRAPDPGDDYLPELPAHERAILVSHDQHLPIPQRAAPDLSARRVPRTYVPPSGARRRVDNPGDAGRRPSRPSCQATSPNVVGWRFRMTESVS